MVRTTLGAEVDTTVTVSGSESVDFINLSQTTSVTAGVTESVALRPPTGSVYEVLSLRVFIPGISGQSSEKHVLLVRSESQGIGVLRLVSDGNKQLAYDKAEIVTATNTQRPTASVSQALTVRGLRVDAQNGIQFRYTNSTNDQQSGTREYAVWVRQIEVSE